MKLINKIPSLVAGAALLMLVVFTIAAVAMRYVFAAPLHWLEEMSGLLMIWIVMIGAIVTERDKQHLSVPMLTDLLPTRLRALVGMLITLLSVAVLGYMAYLGTVLALKAQNKLTEILQISWFWIDIAVPFGAAGVAIYMLYHMRSDIRTFFKGE